MGSIIFFNFCKSDVSAVQGHPRSLILAPIESAYAVAVIVALVCYIVSAILHVFVLLTPPNSTLILGMFPLHQIAHVGVSPSIGLKLFDREIIFQVFQPM